MRRFSILLMVAGFSVGAQTTETVTVRPGVPTFAEAGARFEELRDPSDKLGKSAHSTLSPDFLGAVRKHFHCEQCTSIRARRTSLGKLGEGAVLTQLGNENCGMTNCEFYILYRIQGRVTIADLDDGTDFALQQSRSGVPDIFIASNMGGPLESMTKRFRFRTNRFVESGCNVHEQDDTGKEMPTKTCEPDSAVMVHQTP